MKTQTEMKLQVGWWDVKSERFCYLGTKELNDSSLYSEYTTPVFIDFDDEDERQRTLLRVQVASRLLANQQRIMEVVCFLAGSTSQTRQELSLACAHTDDVIKKVVEETLK